jgi:NADPH:quinone reductase-like Zn-dependent oxidoreductase
VLLACHDPFQTNSGALKPVINRVFTFDNMLEAHQHLENNGQFGKVVVTV